MGRKVKVKKRKTKEGESQVSEEEEQDSCSTSCTHGTSGVARSVYTADIDLFLPEADGDKDVLLANFKLYDLSCDKVMLVLMNPCTLHFYGCVSVKCLAGKADIFGYILHSKIPEVQVYSCEGSSALYMSTVEDWTEETDFDICSISCLGVSFMEATKISNSVKSGGCALLLGEVERKEHARERSGRGERRFGLRLDTVKRNIKNKITVALEIEPDIVPGVTVLCGGRSVGKSTSLRYLINKSLNNFQRVLYIDLDIGQPEFTLQECVSAVVIDKPTLGPSYTHFTKPYISYNVGNIDASRCVDTYLRAVELLVEKCRSSYSDIPWLVNTMGFNKGVGIFINCSCLAIINPSRVIQIDGNKAQNFPSDLTPSYVTSISNRIVSKYRLIKSIKHYNYSKDSSHSSTHSNKQVRWLSTECYFNDSLRPSVPLFCGIEFLTVFNVINKSRIPVEQYPQIVSKIVVLSSSGSLDEPPVAVDYGVILTYIESEKLFVILTPAENYCCIRSILVGSLEIPNRLNKAVDALTSGHIPYCLISSTGKSAPTVKPIRRAYRFLFEPSMAPQNPVEATN